MITDKAFKVIVTCLLAGILAVLTAIYVKMPRRAPTLGDLRQADETTRHELLMKRPLVRVDGSVGVDGSVDVDGRVDIGYAPVLDVHIVR